MRIELECDKRIFHAQERRENFNLFAFSKKMYVGDRKNCQRRDKKIKPMTVI